MDLDPTQRFGNRAADYARARPGYPPPLVPALMQALGLDAGQAHVVDLGSGTGLSAAPFLAAGCRVTGVEPNPAMRAEGAAHLAAYGERFASVAGRAEASGLPDGCADLVIAAQAFHWFDPAGVRAEALRLLRAPARAALIWNDRAADGDPFAAGYEALLVRHGIDYAAVRHRHDHAPSVRAFFGHDRHQVLQFAHPVVHDWDSLAALTQSASYLPRAGEPGGAALMQELRALFDAQAVAGRVTMRYVTRAYAGLIAPD